MKFLKKMNKEESHNWKNAAILGFYTYMLITACNYFYYIAKENVLISPIIVFWSGLVIAFAYAYYLNRKDRKDAAENLEKAVGRNGSEGNR